jgi:DNA ligase (NAD+)
MYELFCPNDKCPAKNVSSYFHFLKTLGVLGIGESKIESLTEAGLIDDFSSFYKLTPQTIQKSSLSLRQGLLVLAAIHMIPTPEKYKDDDLLKKINKEIKVKKVFPLWKLFAAFGIETAGKSAGKALQENFSNIEDILKANVQDFSNINDIGTKTAEVIHNYLSQNKDLIKELLNYIEIESVKVGPLTGQIFVFTGGFAEGKTAWETAVEKLGGKCSSSVSKKVNYVVVGIDAGSKEQKADELGIKKLNIDQLKKMLN